MNDQKFGRLTVLRFVGRNRHGNLKWLCQCTCGNLITVLGSNLCSGRTKSCGCLRHEKLWRGESISPQAAHQWLAKIKTRPVLCERCKERSAEELSYNNVGNRGYSRNPNDYEWLCITCHRFKDLGNGTVMTEIKIREIRKLYTQETVSQRKLANLIGVSQSTIKRIVNQEGVYKQKEI